MLETRRSRVAFSLFTLLAGCALGACSGAEAPVPKAEPPARLSKLIEQKDGLIAQWAAADQKIQERCELSDGDCMIHVRDQRFELLSIHSYPECDGATGEKRERCEEQKAVQQGMGEEIASYYEHHNRCMTQMLACTARLEAEAVEAMKVARAETRKLQIQGLGKSESALVEAMTAKEAAAYLRSTLPPKEEGVCSNLENVTSCLAAAKAKDKTLDAELRKEDAEFDEDYAAGIYQEAREAEASCYQPEFECLSARAARYGETAESIRTLKQNLEIIKQRERLSLRLAEQTASDCKQNAVAQHQSAIISAYTIYAKQPVLFFRKKLHSAFLSLHRAQVACLRGGAADDGGSPKTPSAPAAPPPKKPATPAPEERDSKDSLLQAKR